MPITTEKVLKKFYFTAFEAQLPIEQMTKKRDNGVLSLSGNFIVYICMGASLPSHALLLGKMSVLHWLSQTKTRSKANNTESDESSSNLHSQILNVTANDGDATAQPST